MEIVVDKQQLLAAAKWMDHIAAKRSGSPMLGAVRLTADDMLAVAIHNGDVFIETHVECRVIANGAVCIDSRALIQLLESCKDGQIALEVTDNLRVRATCGQRSTEAGGIDAKNFPVLPKFEQWQPFSLTNLRVAIQGVGFAIGADETKQVTTVLHCEPGRFVATDGNRLAMLDLPAPSTGDLARRFCLELPKLSGDECEASQASKFVAIRCGGTTIGGKAPSDAFVPYDRILPKSFAAYAIVNRVEFVEMVRAATMCSPNKTSTVLLDFGHGFVRVTSSDPENFREFQDQISCEGDGAPVRIGLNGKYVTQALDHLSEEMVRIELNDGTSPIVFKQGPYTHLISPMRI